jgi:hypothetical protein
VEGVAANPDLTRAYFPEGAEHDVFFYVVAPAAANESDVVINELMASNTSVIADNFGEFDDWIELYNRGTAAADISGWYLTDNAANLSKWQVPSGTVIPAAGYTIFWADEDSSQGANHMNFKLSSLGENIMLLNASTLLIDSVVFGVQQTDKAYARVPNGSGPFVIQDATHAANNSPNSLMETSSAQIRVYPNPASDAWYVHLTENTDHAFCLYDASGREQFRGLARGDVFRLDASGLSQGIYFLKLQNAEVIKLVRE